MKFIPVASCLVLAAALPLTASADSTTGVAAKVSSLGLGLELSQRFTPKFGARAGFATFNYDFEHNYDDILYDFELGLGSFNAMLDWHPVEGGFRVSGGVLFNDNQIDAVAQSSNSYSIGGQTYLLGDVGELGGKVGFDSVAPYLGIGWASDPGKAIGIDFDLGVVFQGAPQVSLAASGQLAGDPLFQADLAAEEQGLRNDLEGYEYYPVVGLGISYRF